MNTEQFAQLLNYCNYGSEISQEEEQLAFEHDLVVIFGASDDLMEIRGAINDEVDCYEGAEIYFDKDGIFEACECDCKHSQLAKEKCKIIKAIWGEDGYSWQYKTDIPHATFEIFDDDGKYCKGIVFEKKELEG